MARPYLIQRTPDNNAMHTKRWWCAVSEWLDHCRRSVIAAVIRLTRGLWMKERLPTIAITASVCLPLGILLGVLIHSNQSYSYQTLDSPVGTRRGFGHLTGFFKDDAEWLGGVSRTDSRGKPEWFAFYNRDGKREGPVVNYWPEGNISGIVNYRNDKRHGQYIGFSRNGNLEMMGYYNDGKLVEGSNFRRLDPAPAVNDFFANIERVNQQFHQEAMADFLRDLPEDSIIRKFD